MSVTSPASSPQQPQQPYGPNDIPTIQPPISAAPSYLPGATAPISRPYGSPYAEQPYPHQAPYEAQHEATVAITGRPAKRSRRGWLIAGALVLVALIGGTLTLLFGPISPVKKVVPIGKDSGVAACEALRDKTVVSHAVAGESQADGWARARKLFADSRYGDLRDSGTKVVDLIAQYDGLSSGGNDTGAALFMGPQIIQAYASLSGACSAHGVNIPALGTY